VSTKSAEENGCDFALLGHPSSYAHLVDLFLRSRPDYGRERLHKHKKTIAKLFEWTPCYAIDEPVVLELDDGLELTGRLIVCTFLPEELASARQIAKAHEKSLEGLRLARDLGARVVGLGGFTSIVRDVQGRRVTERAGTDVTSGSCLTAALALAQLDGVFRRLEWRPSERTVAVLGATGEIGRACALALARRARRLLLVARNAAKLEALASELEPHVEVEVSAEPRDVREASVVVAATSAGQPILTEADLRPGSVVCDIGYPKTIAGDGRRSGDVIVVSGGLAELPAPLRIGYYTRLPEHLLYGCFSEAIVLAAADRADRDAIVGGEVTEEKMDRVLALATRRGFRPAPPHHGRHPLGNGDFERFLASAAGVR
jgi:fatty aldehyde-generating acyl-ACP reductase